MHAIDPPCGEAVDACRGRRGLIWRNAAAECKTLEDVDGIVVALHFPHKIVDLFRDDVADRSLARVPTEILGPTSNACIP